MATGNVVHPASRGDLRESAPAEDGQLQCQARIGIAEVRAGQLRDAPQTMAHGVAMQEQLARDGVGAAAAAQICLERVEEWLVSGLRGQGTEDAFEERADVRGRLIEDEAIGAQIVEMHGAAVSVESAPDRERVLRLKEREVRSGRSRLRSRDPRRDIVTELRAHAFAELFGVVA